LFCPTGPFTLEIFVQTFRCRERHKLA
jgi:hypothetical protein